MFLAITWNKKHDYGHTSRLIDSPSHPAAKGADQVYLVKTKGYRPGLYSTKAQILSHVTKA